MNSAVNTIARTIPPLCFLALLSACGEPMYENAGSQHSLLEDREACAAELEQSPEAIAYRQNPTAQPDYVSRVFTEMNRCIERKGWKLLSAQPQQAHELARAEFAQTDRLVPHADEHHRN